MNVKRRCEALLECLECHGTRGRRSVVVLQALLLCLCFSTNGFAYDPNGHLIEIDTAAELDKLRNSSEGCCPADDLGCAGYELKADLDLSSSAPWVPIPLLSCTFDGGGHKIQYLQRLGGGGGFFDVLEGAQVSRLHFEDPQISDAGASTGVLAGVAGAGSTVHQVSVVGGWFDANGLGHGGLIGICEDSAVEESFTAIGTRFRSHADRGIEASGEGGGLIGSADNCIISRSFVLGRTVSYRYAGGIGGLVGRMVGGAIEDSFMSGSAGNASQFGGLIGVSEGSPTILNSYVSGAVIGTGYGGGAVLGIGNATFVSSFYATDTTGYDKTRTGGDEATGVTLADLRCPTSPDDPGCLPGLFVGWGASVNSDGDPAWDFGSAQQAPALRIAGVVYRDSDGDGVLDGEDDFPHQWAASLDEDGDGAINFWREGCDADCRSGSGLVLDQYPLQPAVSLDLDLDGWPDAWNAGCDFACQVESNMTLDPQLDDYDNDGCTDVEDMNDDDPQDCTCPMTGFCDVDSDSDNLIEIRDEETLSLVGNDPTGVSLRTTKIGWDNQAPEDTSGCRPRIVRGVLTRGCDGYELVNDIVYTNADAFTPIGHLGDDPHEAFQTNFEGNGHTITGIVAEGNASFEAGFFGGTRGANIRNLGLIDTSVIGVGSAIGALVGIATNSKITHCYAISAVEPMVSGEGLGEAGGLVGRARGSEIVGSFVVGTVHGHSATSACAVGGIAGEMTEDSTITAGFAAGLVSDDCNPSASATNDGTGGLVGFAEAGSLVMGSYAISEVQSSQVNSGGLVGFGGADVISSYWATDTSNQTGSAGNAQGALVDELECPTAANETVCLPEVVLYDGWDTLGVVGNPPYWDFGSESELPGLCMAGTMYRPNASGSLEAPTACACTAQLQELVTNQGFESGTSGWTGLGATLSSSTAQAHTGSSSLRISNRSQTWNGAEYNLLGLAHAGETLSASLWARIEGAPNEPVYLTLRSICQGQSAMYERIVSRTATNDNWVQLAGTVEIPDCELTELVAYAEGPSPSVTFYVDDVSFATTALTCSGGSGDLYGEYTVHSDWGGGYCLEMVIHNPTSQATTDWSAIVDLNGAAIEPNNYWNLNTSGLSGTVTLTPGEPWVQTIQPSGTSHSLGFCANRAAGDTTSLPIPPVVTASF